MQDITVTTVSQYKNSPVINAIIFAFNDAVDPAIDFDSFVYNIWDITTATGYGLDVWGRIVDVSRVVQISSADYFGFSEAGSLDPQPFDQAPFYNNENLTSNFSLMDDDYRNLIYAKALANISNGSIPALNQILQLLFPGRGNAYVVDSGNMSFVYKFDFSLTPVERSIIIQSGVLPSPTGVSVTYQQAS